MFWSFLLLLFVARSAYGFRFTIVHNNDMHARYEPMRGQSDSCSRQENEKGLCFGGFARVATAIADARAEGPTLYLNAGDTFHGTLWYQVYKGHLAAYLMNLLEPDAVALGNHEFDDNVTGLLPFLSMAKFPIVSCNLDVRKVLELQTFPNLMRSTVITKLGRKIGIIGYITPLTKYYVPYNKVEYLDEISSINREASLLTKQGVDIIIALGHSGYNKDRMIALVCPDVDVVIGGHSHTFLYSGTPPDYDKPEGPYPTVMTRRSGQQVPVVQAYAYTKYLGKIDLEFDDNGDLMSFNGTVLLLDKWIPEDENITAILDIKRSPIDLLQKQYLPDKNEFLKSIKAEHVEHDTRGDISFSEVYATSSSIGKISNLLNAANLISLFIVICILS